MTFDTRATRELVRRAIAGATATPRPGFEGRTIAAVNRLRTDGEGAAEPARRSGRRPRGLVLALVAGAVILALGLTTALAQGGVLSDGLAEGLANIGLGGTANQYTPVEASATDAGITLHAAAAYADSSVVGVAVHTDAAPDKELNYPQDPKLTDAAGDVLIPSSGAPDRTNENDYVIFFSPPGAETIHGSEFTLTVHRISRGRPQMLRGHSVFVPIPDAQGTWVLHIRVAPTVARSTPIPTPVSGDINDVHVSFTGFRRSGPYVAGEIDLSAPTAAAMSRALAMNNGSALMHWMLTPDLPVTAGFPLANASATFGAPTVHQDGAPPIGKGAPPAGVASHYQEHVVWVASKPGTYHLVVGSGLPDGGPWIVQAIPVR